MGGRKIMVMVLGCGVILASAAQAQKGADAAALDAELNRLHQSGKYREATEIAKRVLSIREKALGPNHPDVAQTLTKLAGLYHDQGRYAEAEPLYKRSLAIQKKALGHDHPDVALLLNNLAMLYRAQGHHREAETLYKQSLALWEKAPGRNQSDLSLTLNNLAELYWAMGRYAEAEPLYKRSLAMREKALGANHPGISVSLNNLAELYRTQGRYVEAEPLYQRSLAISEKALGRDHVDLGPLLNNLANLYGAQGRYAEAERLSMRNLALREKALGPDHPHVGLTLNNVAALYFVQGRYAEAEPLFKRALAVREKALGPDHSDVGQSLSNLADLYRVQGRYTEAEPLLKRSLAITERALGPDHPDVSGSLTKLAQLYQVQDRYKEAEPLLKRSLAVNEKALGPDHPQVGLSINNLAALFWAERRYTDAEPLLKRSLYIREKALGPEHPEVSLSINNLATIYVTQGRYAEAEPLFKRALAAREKTLGPDHLHVAHSLNNLGELHRVQGRYVEAEAALKRSLGIRQKALGPDHPEVAMSLNHLAALAHIQKNRPLAADYLRQSTDLIRRRASREIAGGHENLSGGEAHRNAWQFLALVRTTYVLAAGGVGPKPTVAAEMFETAQWAQGSEAAASLAQMAARSAKGSPQLAGLVRERQDLVTEWRTKDKLLTAAKSEVPASRKAEIEKSLAERLAAIDARLADIGRLFARDFPDYAALASPAPSSIAEVQAQLGPDEALVLFLDTPAWNPTPEETFIWVLTKSDVRWVRSDLGTAMLASEVAALRCGLDATAWFGDGAEKCSKASGIPLANAPHPNQPLPFDHGRAHKLYAALFGEVHDVIKGKHLLIVPSGPLTQLPFQVLVTMRPASADRTIDWLTREHAITVLPAVSSLSALRRVSKPSTATRPMIGFGNPLLDGSHVGHAHRASLARQRQRCPETRREQVSTLDGPPGGVSGVETRGGLADVSLIKMQVPLPETADELCDVAQDVKAEARDIHLGARATERVIKRLSDSGELAKYRVVHFATHGVLAGQLDDTHEPGLILTPPDKATEEDDGYLSASEIATLKLDADWVILSACNTAAGASTSAEALSGLARAFIYAQARALLVSHWDVYSNATVKLITTAIREMARDPKVGRAEAMRRSMLAFIDKGEPHEAHPAYWAPFVVVGEGAAGR